MSTAVQIAGGTFSESAHQYKNTAGLVRPSTTQILEGVGLTDLDGVPGDTLERKRALGDAVHFATAIIDRNKFFKGPELDWETVHESTVPYIMAHENVMRETGFIPEEVEHPGIHTLNGMEYGYTLDRIGRFPGMNCRAVVELKCSYKEEYAWRVQLASYVLTVPKKKDEFVARFTFQLKPDTTFKIFPYENPRDIDVFEWALALTYTKINNGIPWLKQ